MDQRYSKYLKVLCQNLILSQLVLHFTYDKCVYIFTAVRDPTFQSKLRLVLAAISAYESQLSSFWTDGAEMRRRVTDYALLMGAGAPAERMWIREELKVGAREVRTKQPPVLF